MEVAAGEYGDDKVKQLKSAVQDGYCEPFQEEFERKNLPSGSSTPSDHSSCLGDDDGDISVEKEMMSHENGCCNGDVAKESLKNGNCLGSEVGVNHACSLDCMSENLDTCGEYMSGS